MKLFLSLIFSIFFTINIFAQEYTVSLSNNPEIQSYLKKKTDTKSTTKNKAVSELPFWDDFSADNIYPNPNLWSDKTVYINRTLAVNPPSIGVATLDAVDSQCKIY